RELIFGKSECVLLSAIQNLPCAVLNKEEIHSVSAQARAKSDEGNSRPKLVISTVFPDCSGRNRPAILQWSGNCTQEILAATGWVCRDFSKFRLDADGRHIKRF